MTDTPRQPAANLALLLTALALGPAGWIAQLVGDYAVAGYACFGGRGMRAAPLFGPGETPALLAINVVGVATALVGAVIGYRLWRGAAEGRLETDAHRARTRFLASCALIASLGFAGAALFGTIEPLVTEACWRFGP